MSTKTPPDARKGSAIIHGSLTRREFTSRVTAIASGAALASTVPALWRTANAADTLKVGFISPRSGPLAGFGEGDPYVIGLVRQTLAKGFTIGGKTYSVEFFYNDTQSNHIQTV